MSVLDAYSGASPESTVSTSSAWTDHARASLLSDTNSFSRISTGTEPSWLTKGTEPSWLGGLTLEDGFHKPAAWSALREDCFDRGADSEAAKDIYNNMPADKRVQLDKEIAQYDKEVKQRSVMIGIGIHSPEPGPAMKEFQKQVDGVVKRANEQVDAQMTPFEKEQYNHEKEKYEDEEKRHMLDANINYTGPEPGAMMQEHARRVIEAIRKIAVQPGGEASTSKPQGDAITSQTASSDSIPAIKPSNDSMWARLGFTSPDVLAFDQEAPSRAETRLGKIWEEIKDVFGQADTVNDRLKQAVESKLSPQEKTDLAKQEKEFHKKQMESLRGGFGWGADAPDLNDYPLIQKRDQMLRDAEQGICNQVRNQMSPADKKELNAQFMEYAEAMKSYRESSVFKLRPQPGQAIQKFYQSVGHAVENYGKQQAA